MKEFYRVCDECSEQYYFKTLDKALDYLWKIYMEEFRSEDETEEEMEKNRISLNEDWFIDGVGGIDIVYFQD